MHNALVFEKENKEENLQCFLCSGRSVDTNRGNIFEVSPDAYGCG